MELANSTTQINHYSIKSIIYSPHATPKQFLVLGVTSLCYCILFLGVFLNRYITTQVMDLYSAPWIILSAIVGSLSIYRGSFIKKQLDTYNCFDHKKTDKVLMAFGWFFLASVFWVIYEFVLTFVLSGADLSYNETIYLNIYLNNILSAATFFVAVFFTFSQKNAGTAIAIGLANWIMHLSMPDYMDLGAYFGVTFLRDCISVVLFALIPYSLPQKKVPGLIISMFFAAILSFTSAYVAGVIECTVRDYGSMAPFVSSLLYDLFLVDIAPIVIFVLICGVKYRKNSPGSRSINNSVKIDFTNLKSRNTHTNTSPESDNTTNSPPLPLQTSTTTTVSNQSPVPQDISSTRAKPNFCRICGSKLSKDGLFCQACGTKIEFRY